ncbi:aminotransferase-like domain-containing protein [Lignipirellula cremea]|uniref:2-aminoadipate transaminase n=1 Tax=Lignipirellula cremea TaxID=2528010 RepID=A0A518E4R8_9BACT|nr:PLP-dependent aminotransferase family protein [Lignipirellula cremea]QDU99068.1 2-aminoadipate transaminase [Lignipirellula cremea]
MASLPAVSFQPSQRSQWAEGQPISELMSRALANPNLISLAAGFVDRESLPVEPTRLGFERMFANSLSAQTALQYGTTPGFPPLRTAILKQMQERGEADGVTIDQIVVTAGSNQLLHLVCESLLDPGDIVICASPTYLVFIGTLNNLGARSVGACCDEQGLTPDGVERTLQAIDDAGELSRVKAIYTVPYYDNPCGLTMPVGRRQALVEIAKRWSRENRIHLIEDAAYRELRYEGEDAPSMRTFDADGETVITAGTFSKSFSPGIRVGWGVLPKHLVAPVCNQKGNIDFGSPNFSQHLMAEVLQGGLFEPHVEKIRDAYRVKLHAMLEAADEFLAPLPGVRWDRPTGGLYVWLVLPPGIDCGPRGQLFDAAIAEGMFYVPGQYCFPTEGEPVRKNTIRLSFGVQSPEKIRRGMEALARAIGQVQDSAK